jgi:hypothetical protein
MCSFHVGRSRCLGLAAVALALAGCASDPKEPVVRTVEVKVPVAVACVPEGFPKAPEYPDSDKALKAAPGGAERYQLIQAGRILRVQRAAETEPMIEGCRKP